MTPKLYKAADVCRLAELPHYVLQSWEREFPGIGVQKSADAPRLYRQSDVDQVLRIRQLVVVEGLTLSGARRRLEEMVPAASTSDDVLEVMEVIGADAQQRLAHVRDGLRSLLHLLDGRGRPGTAYPIGADSYELTPPGAAHGRKVVPARSKAPVSARKVVATRGKSNATKRVTRAR
jgi:DNA-binding transcriptional MerR regulator